MPEPNVIRSRLDAARRELLDLTTRNRLLSTPRHRARTRTIEVVRERSAEVFLALIDERRVIGFLPGEARRPLTDPPGAAPSPPHADEASEARPAEVVTAAPPPPGVGQPDQRVGPWVLERLLGRGAFGEVWKARHHELAGQFAAVKLATDAAYVRYLRNESRITHSLAHEGIVAVLDADPYSDPPYLATEYVDGESLRARLGRGLGFADGRGSWSTLDN